jgi:hypothetical protein
MAIGTPRVEGLFPHIGVLRDYFYYMLKNYSIIAAIKDIYITEVGRDGNYQSNL